MSRDFVKWARLPVSIWNDKWYDSVAIFSGSTTIVDGKPVIVCELQKAPTDLMIAPQKAPTASLFPSGDMTYRELRLR